MNVYSLHRAGDLRPFGFGLCFALVLAVLAVACHPSVSAQEATRKVKKSVRPDYPELAKRFDLRGTVRVQVLIAADGKVKETKVLGGNPVLAKAAVEAAQKWVFEPEPQASTMVLKFDFNP